MCVAGYKSYERHTYYKPSAQRLHLPTAAEASLALFNTNGRTISLGKSGPKVCPSDEIEEMPTKNETVVYSTRGK